jgi:NitT/TauT family transport system permease protein
MVFLPQDRSDQSAFAAFTRARLLPNAFDIIVFLLIVGGIAIVLHGASVVQAPLSAPGASSVSLDVARLPEYAVRTTLRMFAAILASLVFTFVVATLAAKSRKAEMIIIPALDILQSVPVLGFLTFTVTFFLGLFPGSVLGAECASVFAIFTAQAWNMAFSFYQSLKTVPADLDEVSRGFGLSSWQRFWRLEAPFAAPGLIWNTMMSMSGSWFFIVASEAISVGNATFQLPGIGSYLALAITKQDFGAVGYAVLAMGIIILLYDQLLFRPIVAWADKFRFEQTAGAERPRSWVYTVFRRARLFRQLTAPLASLRRRALQLRLPKRRRAPAESRWARMSGRAMQAALVAAAIAALVAIGFDAHLALSWEDAGTAVAAGAATLLRVLVLIVIASAVWVPIGIWVGLRPKAAQRVQPVAQFLAAFPANVLFPVAVIVLVATHADPNIWLSPLMILGTQWYILFNVIAGASVFPNDLKEAAAVYRIRSWTWWRRVALPGIFPYYVTGALTASGGSWNASIVAEVVTWGDHKLEAFGLGSYIADATAAGDYSKVALGIAVMALFVTVLNRTLWRPLYVFAERRLRLA